MSDSVFVSAVRHMQQAEVHVEPDIQNRLYGLYKQATEGDCAQEAPARSDRTVRAKWEAWKSVRGLSRQEAMENYVMHVRNVDKSWTPQATPAAANVAGPGKKQGVLYKQRDVFKGWRPRVFVLDEEMAALHYYLEEDDIQGGQPRKSILLTGSVVTEVMATKNQDREFFPFVLSHPHASKTYNLASTSKEDVTAWIHALREAAARAPGAVVEGRPDPTERILARHVPKSVEAIEAKSDDLDLEGRARIPREFVTKVETAVETLLETGGTLDDWQPAFEKNGVIAYRRPGSLVCVRGDGEIDYPMTDVFRTVIDVDRRKEWDPQLATGKRIRKFSSNTWVDHLKFKQVWPTAARDLVNLCHWRLLDDGTVIIVAFSQKFDDIAPREDGVVRAECIIAGYIIRPIKSGKAVKMTYLVQTDLKGTIPTSVVNMVAQGQPMLVAALRKVLDTDTQNQNRPRLLLPTRRHLTTADLELIFENYNDPSKLSAASAGASESKASASPTPAGASSPRNAAARPESVRTQPGQAAQGGGAAAAAAAAGDSTADPTGQSPRSVGLASLLVLFLPVVLYFLPNSKYRGLAFVAGCMFAFRYIFKLHMGTPRSDTDVLATEQITDGRMLVRFNIEVGRLLRYLDEKRKHNDVEISLTHVAVKAAGLALHECTQLNGRVVLGAFYPSDDIDVSVSLNNSDGGNAVVKVVQAHRKPVDYIADEVVKLTKTLSNPNNKEVHRMKAIRKFFRSLPPALGAYCERALHYLGAHLGLSIPALGVQPFPLGSCTIVTAPPPSPDNAATLDVDMTVIPTKFNAATPITLTIGGMHVAPKLDSENRMVATHVQGMTATIDCRAATLPQGRQFAEKVQEFLSNPQLLDKFDRQEMNAIERRLSSKRK